MRTKVTTNEREMIGATTKCSVREKKRSTNEKESSAREENIESITMKCNASWRRGKMKIKDFMHVICTFLLCRFYV